MAFHPYPQVIRILFNGNRFGPPAPVTAPSACPGVDHKVSRPPPRTQGPIRTRFRSGCAHQCACPRPRRATRRLIMQKARRHPQRAPTACRHMVSGSLSLRFPRCFSPFPHGTCPLSVSQECLALADGAARFRQGFSGPALLRVQARLQTVSLTGLSPSTTGLSRPIRLPYGTPYTLALQPRTRRNAPGLGYSPFARRYLGSHCCFPFLRLLRCFSSPG